MQTFLPYPDFKQSAEVLDKRRCWKQVVEVDQILNAMVYGCGWKNHPAVKMWEGYIPALKKYFNCFLRVAKEKHHINTSYEPYGPEHFDHLSQDGIGINLPLPWWLGDENFHRAMRARLIEKDRNFYLPLFPEDEGFNNGKYFWPVMETKTFRII